MKLIALKAMGRLRPGDVFEKDARQGRALIAVGRARAAPPDEPAAVEPGEERVVPRYDRRDMQAVE